MNKLIPFLAFSILLLVPVGAQNVFANHPQLACPPPGILNTDPTILENVFGTSNFCYAKISSIPGPLTCPPGYSPGTFFSTTTFPLVNIGACIAEPQPTPDPTHPDQCQGASFLFENHCFAEALSSIVGGELLSINTIPLLLGAIGTNPIITGLVGITIAGVVGQTAWFVHRRRKSENS